MMINIAIDPGFSGSFADLYTQMNPVVAGASAISASAKRVVFENTSGATYVLTGSHLTFSGSVADGTLALTGGAVDGLSLSRDGAKAVSFTSLQTTGDQLWQAFQDEARGVDPTAVTHLLVHHCWTYHGNGLNDYFPRSETADFGLLDPTGMDRIYLYGGDDVFFTGSNTDTIFGGNGNDSISGGDDADSLLGGNGDDVMDGGSGADVAYGGWGRDTITGGGGADTLMGSLGQDSLEGGTGADRLTGGRDADLFVFAAGSGADIITDFENGVDRIRIAGVGVDAILAQGHDTLIQFGSDTILVLGVSADQITPDDFV